jgi:hypothetical protein
VKQAQNSNGRKLTVLMINIIVYHSVKMEHSLLLLLIMDIYKYSMLIMVLLRQLERTLATIIHRTTK